MLVTALAHLLGYETAAEIAPHALRNDLVLRDAAISPGRVTAEDFDRIVDPAEMLRSEG